MAFEDILNTSSEELNSNILSGDQLQSPDFSMDSLEQQNGPIDPPGTKSSFENSMKGVIKSAFNESFAPKQTNFIDDLGSAKGAKVKYYSPEHVDKFKSQSSFDPFGFDPSDYETNLKAYADKETWGSSLSKGFDSFAFNFGNTFTGWFADYPKMVDAVLSADWDKMKPDEESLVNEYYKQQKNANENFVFTQAGEEDDIFSKKFVSEFIGNSGFALGTTAALGLELLADMTITAATEGGGSGLIPATFGRLSAKTAARETAKEAVEAGAKSNMFSNFFKGYNAGIKPLEEIPGSLGVLKQMQQAEAVASVARSSKSARSLINDYATMFSSNIFNIGKSKGLGEFVGNFVKGAPLLGTGVRYGEKMAFAYKNGAQLSHLAGMGVQGTRRLMQELNMSASEAYFEGISTYGDTLDRMSKQYQLDHNGNPPSPLEFEKMKELATKASSSNYDTNMGVLLITNHLQFGNLFNKYVPANKFVRDFVEESSENIIKITSKEGLKGIVKKGPLGTIGVIGKISTDFGKKEAAYQLGKSAFKNFAAFEVSEGLQENIQETTAAGWRDYYSGKFNGVKYTLSDAMNKGIKEQASKQGFKTFLMGALTGSLIRVPSKVMNSSLDYVNNRIQDAQYKGSDATAPYKRYEKQLDDDIALLNNFIKKGKNGTFEEKLFNFAAQTQAASDQTQTAGNGLRYEFENGRNNALLAAVSAANRTDSVDAFLTSIKTSISEMDNESFEKEFGVKIEDTEYNSPQQFGEKVTEDIKKYSKAIDDFVRGYKTKFEDPTRYAPDSKDYAISSYIRLAEEEALHIAAMNSIKATMAVDRAKQIGNELTTNALLSNSSDMVLRVLTDPKMLISEMGNLKAELALLKQNANAEGLDVATKKQIKSQIKEKESQLSVLDEWASFYDTRQAMSNRDGIDSNDNTVVFAGKRIEKKLRQRKYASAPQEVNYTYNQKDKAVIKAFKKLILSKNKEAGIDTEIRDSELEEALDKLIDYMQLDQDTKDYINAVEVLTNKENFRQVTTRLMDGKFKFNLIMYADSLMDSFKKEAGNILLELHKSNKSIGIQEYVEMIEDAENTLLKNESYIKLLSIITSDNFGINNQEEALKLTQDISLTTKRLFEKYLQMYTSGERQTDISDEEYNEIMSSNELGVIRTVNIANKLFKAKGNVTVLNERELKLYETFKDIVDSKVEDLKIENKEYVNNNEVETAVAETNTLEDDATEEIGKDTSVEDEYDETDQAPPGSFNFNFEEDDEDTAEVTPTEPKATKKVEEEISDVTETESELTLDKLEELFSKKIITKEQYDSEKKVLVVIDKIKALHTGTIDSLANTVVTIVSAIEANAERKGVDFMTYFNNKKNATLIKEIILKEIAETNNGETLEETPVVVEPVIIETNNYDKTKPVSNEFDISVIDEINDVLESVLAGQLIQDVNAVLPGTRKKNQKKSEKNVNFVSEIVTEQSVIDKLKNNKLEC